MREQLRHCFFFFNDTATTEIYTLSLHDALPITSRKSTRASTTTPRARLPPRWRPGVSKGKSVFRCTECGADQPKWGGKCDACGAWNSLVEEPIRRTVGRSDRRTASSDSQTVRLSDLGSTKLQRWRTGLAEFDFVLGDRKSVV